MPNSSETRRCEMFCRSSGTLRGAAGIRDPSRLSATPLRVSGLPFLAYEHLHNPLCPLNVNKVFQMLILDRVLYSLMTEVEQIFMKTLKGWLPFRQPAPKTKHVFIEMPMGYPLGHGNAERTGLYSLYIRCAVNRLKSPDQPEQPLSRSRGSRQMSAKRFELPTF